LTAYLGLEDALQIVERFGFHLRDIGLLGSALARPATTLAGSDAYAALELKAAALLESALRNHPLIDGNKRTAWTLMSAFLWINGARLDMGTGAAFDLVIGVAEGRIDLTASAAIIAAGCVPRDA
jgi:death-on-curing protein